MSDDIPVINQILARYPRFYYQDADGNHYKYNDAIAEEGEDYNFQKELVSRVNDLNRPLQIWKQQALEYQYFIYYKINVDNAVSTKLYTPNAPGSYDHYIAPNYYDINDNIIGTDTLLTATYDKVNDWWFYSTSGAEIIPTKKFYIQVIGSDGKTYEKGYPQSATPNGDMYDMDKALDIMGTNFDVPRRVYKSSIAEVDYPRTVPPFYILPNEDDYSYQERMKQHIIDYFTKPYPAVQVFKYYGVMPTIIGRWRDLCHINEDYMVTELCRYNTDGSMASNSDENDGTYFSTTEWSNAVFDIITDLNSVPTNINLPSQDSIEKVIQRAFPLSKKAYFALLTHYPDITKHDPSLNEVEGVAESWPMTLLWQFEDAVVEADISAFVVTPKLDDTQIYPTVDMCAGLVPVSPAVGESISAVQFDTVLNSALYADFNLGTYLSHTYADSYWNCIALDSGLKSLAGYPTTGYNSTSYGCPGTKAWANPTLINDTSTANYASAAYGGNAQTEFCIGAFSLGIPGDATITRVTVETNHKQYINGSGYVYDFYEYIRLADGQATNTYGDEYSANNTWRTHLWDSDVNNWDNDDNQIFYFTPANVNTMLVGFTTSLCASGCTAYLNYIRVTAYYYFQNGQYVTQAVSLPGGSSWSTVNVWPYIPTPGSQNMTFDVLGDGDAVRLSNQPGGAIDISGLSDSQVKVRCNLWSSIVSSTPSLTPITIQTKKPFTF